MSVALKNDTVILGTYSIHFKSLNYFAISIYFLILILKFSNFGSKLIKSITGAPGTDQALGRAYQYDLLNPMDEAIEMEDIPTPQNTPTKDKYIGYSSVICNMDGDDWNGDEMIFGGPRGEMYSGEVSKIVNVKLVNCKLFEYSSSIFSSQYQL